MHTCRFYYDNIGVQTSRVKSWKVVEEGSGREKMWLNVKKKEGWTEGVDRRWKNKNAKTEGVNVRWQLPHVRICCSPSEHFSLHAMARAGGAQWEREGERKSDTRVASVMTGLPPFLFLSRSRFSSSLTLFLLVSSFPIIHPWTSAHRK